MILLLSELILMDANGTCFAVGQASGRKPIRTSPLYQFRITIRSTALKVHCHAFGKLVDSSDALRIESLSTDSLNPIFADICVNL